MTQFKVTDVFGPSYSSTDLANAFSDAIPSMVCDGDTIHSICEEGVEVAVKLSYRRHQTLPSGAHFSGKVVHGRILVGGEERNGGDGIHLGYHSGFSVPDRVVLKGTLVYDADMGGYVSAPSYQGVGNEKSRDMGFGSPNEAELRAIAARINRESIQ